jgi:hypothetical protein
MNELRDKIAVLIYNLTGATPQESTMLAERIIAVLPPALTAEQREALDFVLYGYERSSVLPTERVEAAITTLRALAAGQPS